MLIVYDVPDMEDISAELNGVLGEITALQVSCAEELRLSPHVMYSCLFGIQKHLKRVVDDVNLLIDDSFMKKRAASSEQKEQSNS